MGEPLWQVVGQSTKIANDSFSEKNWWFDTLHTVDAGNGVQADRWLSEAVNAV